MKQRTISLNEPDPAPMSSTATSLTAGNPEAQPAPSACPIHLAVSAFAFSGIGGLVMSPAYGFAVIVASSSQSRAVPQEVRAVRPLRPARNRLQGGCCAAPCASGNPGRLQWNLLTLGHCSADARDSRIETSRSRMKPVAGAGVPGFRRPPAPGPRSSRSCTGWRS